MMPLFGGIAGVEKGVFGFFSAFSTFVFFLFSSFCRNGDFSLEREDSGLPGEVAALLKELLLWHWLYYWNGYF